MCVCLSVCLSPTRSRQWNVVSSHFFRWRKEILLASCTNCSSRLYDAWFERNCVWNFWAGYALEPVHVRYTSRLPWAGRILPPLERRWNIFKGHVLTETHVNELQRKKDKRREQVTEQRLEGYTLKDMPMNGL